MALPALLAAGLIGFALGVIGSDEAAKADAEKERKRHEDEAKKATWLETEKEHVRQQAEEWDMIADSDEEDNELFDMAGNILLRRDGESEEEHTTRLCALYAIGAHVGYFAPETDIDEEMLGEPERSDLIAELESGVSFDAIKEKYLDRLAAGELRSLDGIVRHIIFVEGDTDDSAYDFYAYKWKPYLDARLKG